jgi:hypothetical protein
MSHNMFVPRQCKPFALQPSAVEVEFHALGQCLNETAMHLEQQAPEGRTRRRSCRLDLRTQ